MKKKFRAIKWLAALVACMILTGCGGQTAQVAPELIAPVNADIATVEVIRQTAEQIECFPGSVTSASRGLYYERSGRVGSVSVRIGDRVSAGDVLVSLDIEDALERAEKLERELAELNSETEYRKTVYAVEREKLAAKVDTARGKVNKFNAETDLLALDLAHEQFLARQEAAAGNLMRELDDVNAVIAGKDLVSPIDGEVTYLSVCAGASVSEYDVIACVSDGGVLRVSTASSVNESSTAKAVEIYALIGGEKLYLSRDPFDYDQYIATTAAGGVYRTCFTLLDPSISLNAGDYAYIVVVRARSEGALVAPPSAVFSDGGRDYVYVIHPDMSREKREVTVGIRSDYLIEITRGVEEGEKLYVAG